MCTYSWKLGSHESLDDVNYWRFHHQLLHTSLQKILEPIRPYMTAPKVVNCPGSLPSGHFLAWTIHCRLPRAMSSSMHCSRMFSWYVYIDFSLINGFSCNAPSDDIDSGQFIPRSKAYTELLCDGCEIQQLWDNYGIVGKIKVAIFTFLCTMHHYASLSHLQPFSHVPIFMIKATNLKKQVKKKKILANIDLW